MKIQQSVTCFTDDWTYNGPVFLPKHHNNKTLNLNKITMKEITYKAVTGVVSLHLYFVSTPKWYILVPLERAPHQVTASYLFSWKCMCIHDQWIWHKHLQHALMFLQSCNQSYWIHINAFLNTHLNLPWQCWHWSPTHPRSQTQDPFTHLPDRQPFSQGSDGEPSEISTRENITHSHKYLCVPCSLCLTRNSSGLSILFPAFMV